MDKTDSANSWLAFADQQDYERTWNSSSAIFQSAIALENWKKSLRSARMPLGEMHSRELHSTEYPFVPEGAPDGRYAKLLLNSSFEKKQTAQETITLVEDSVGQWRVAGYFIK